MLNVSNIIPQFSAVSFYNLTTRSGKPTTIRAKEPVSATIRLGERIFWSRAALRFSLGSCSLESIWGMETSSEMVRVTGHECIDKETGEEMLRSPNEEKEE